MDADNLRALLGADEAEVPVVEETPAGWVGRHRDGTAYVYAEKADAEGKTGLMFLVAPEGYGGTFPVYAQPGAVDTETPVDPAQAAAADAAASAAAAKGSVVPQTSSPPSGTGKKGTLAATESSSPPSGTGKKGAQ